MLQTSPFLTKNNVTLRSGAAFVAKIFRGRDVNLLYDQLRILFTRVSIAKPSSSRNSSIEAFVVCQGFKGGEWKDLPLEGGFGGDGAGGLALPAYMTPTDRDRFAVPFLACGDLDGVDMKGDLGFLDADRSYDVDEGEGGLRPVQAPINLPFEVVKEATENAETK